jgi:predicted negative regulator of RcsB-dependent stress response
MAGRMVKLARIEALTEARDLCASYATKNFEAEKRLAARSAKLRKIGDPFGHGEMQEMGALELASAGREAEALQHAINKLIDEARK